MNYTEMNSMTAKFTCMVIVNGGSFKNDVMTVIELEALLFDGETYTVRMQRVDEV